jgi:membrane-associated phospholipid phosphatase
MNHELEDLMRGRVLSVCAGGLALLAALTVPFYGRYGLDVLWASAAGAAAGLLVLVALALYFIRYPGRPEERALGDMVLVLSLVVALVILLTPAQYLAVALKRPLIDPWLAQADARLGINVPALAAWTRSHPGFDALLQAGYFTLLPQFIVAPLLLGIVFRSRERLWEYTFHFYTCALATLAALAIFPAACAFQYFHFSSTISQAHFISHFNAVRAGTFGPLRFGELEGLVSMPSFHVAGGLFVTWALRERRVVCTMFALLNVILILATVLSGAHYFVDVIASFGLFAVSALAYSRLSLAPSSSKASERTTAAAA